MDKINLIALIGPSGSGKDTLLKQLKKECPKQFHYIKNTTTRPKRDKDDNDYYFISKEKFALKALCGEFVEKAEFNGWWYGTEFCQLSPNKINIGIFNIEGLKQLLEQKNLDVYIIYIKSSDKIRLLRQLNRQENPDVNEVIRRFLTDQKDFSEPLPFYYTYYRNNKKEDINKFTEFIRTRDLRTKISN